MAVCEEPLWPEMLPAAQELFLGNSVRGILPVRSLRGPGREALEWQPCPGELAQALVERFVAWKLRDRGTRGQGYTGAAPASPASTP